MKKTMIALMSATALSAGLSSAPAIASTNPYVGEIMPVGFNFCPRGWANADGQLQSISANTALFSLYGTIYGGDGRTTFALPDLRGRSPIHTGTGPGLTTRPIGQRSGTETNTLTVSQMPSHTHTANILAAHLATADSGNPKGNAFGRSTTANIYENTDPPSTSLADAMHSGTVVVQNTGNNLSVNNMSPYLTLRYCVALQGVYPSRN